MNRARTSALVVSAALMVAGAAGVSPSAAQEQASVRLVVTELTGVLGPGSAVPFSSGVTEAIPRLVLEPVDEDLRVAVLVSNDGRVPLADLRLVVEVYPAIDGGRSALQDALDRGEITELPQTAHDEALLDGASLDPGAVVGADHTVSADDAQWDEDGGVHPVSISVLQGSQVLDRVDTAVVYMATRTPEPLSTALVWPLTEAPWRLAGGAYPPDVDRSIQPGGRLERLVSVLERHRGAGVLLAPAAHLLEDLQDRADGFDVAIPSPDGEERVRRAPESAPAQHANRFLQRVRTVAADQALDPVAGAYARADLAGLLGASQPELAAVAGMTVREGRRRLQVLLGREPDAATFLAGGDLGERALELLAGHHILLPWEAAEIGTDGAVPSRLDDPLRIVTADSGRRLTASIGDPYLSQLLEALPADHGPVIAAQRVLAATAMVFFEAPDAPGRTLTLLPPPEWAPGPRTADVLLGRLVQAPWIDLADPSAQAAAARAVPPGSLAPSTSDLGERIGSELAAARENLAALRASLPDDVARIDGRAPADLTDQLLRAPSRWFSGLYADRSTALVDDVEAAVDATFGEVEVSGGTRVTLTSDNGQIPVTLQRDAEGPLLVRVHVQSQGRLVWPEGRESDPIALGPEDSQTVSFATKALSRGTFPVSVRVTDVTGSRLLDRSTLSVRATAISRPALIVTGGVVVALLLWGLLRRRRWRRRPGLTVVDTDRGVDARSPSRQPHGG